MSGRSPAVVQPGAAPVEIGRDRDRQPVHPPASPTVSTRRRQGSVKVPVPLQLVSRAARQAVGPGQLFDCPGELQPNWPVQSRRRPAHLASVALGKGLALPPGLSRSDGRFSCRDEFGQHSARTRISMSSRIGRRASRLVPPVRSVGDGVVVDDRPRRARGGQTCGGTVVHVVLAEVLAEVAGHHRDRAVPVAAVGAG
jgi:hypothetical protein